MVHDYFWRAISVDAPSPPQELRSKTVEYHINYSTIIVLWEPPQNDSRVDHYLYKFAKVADMSVDEVILIRNTTNTTVVLSDIPYGINITFVVSAYNCEGVSAQKVLVINIGK